MRILVANHTASISGAEVVLLRLLESLRSEHVIAVACPNEGPLAQALDQALIRRTPVPACEASFRPHPVRTPTGIMRICAGGAVLARSARRMHADVLYANTTRAALMGVVARRLGAPPLVVRLHDQLPTTPFGQAVRSVIAGTAAAVIAVSEYTARAFNEGLSRPIATRVYNGIDHSRFDPDQVPSANLHDELGIATDAVLLGQVAQITPWKAQDDAIRTLAELRRRDVNAHLVLVGAVAFTGKQVRYDNPAFLESLHRLVRDLRVDDTVHFLGPRDDVPALLRALDLSLLPSLNEPFALAATESMAMGTPVFVSRAGGSAELVEDGVTGRVLPARRPDLWAEAVRATLMDRPALERMGARAREAAVRRRDDAHAGEILAILERAASDGWTANRSYARTTGSSPQTCERSPWPN